MKELEGYVCIGRYPGVDVLYGRSTRIENQTFQSLNTNGFLPFTTPEEAGISKREILEKMRNFTDVYTGKIKLSIVEDPPESRLIGDKEGFIVLMQKSEDEWLMIGASQEGQANLYPLLGADLKRNGLTPFTNIEDAVEAAREAARQAQSYTTIARFQLEEIS